MIEEQAAFCREKEKMPKSSLEDGRQRKRITRRDSSLRISARAGFLTAGCLVSMHGIYAGKSVSMLNAHECGRSGDSERRTS